MILAPIAAAQAEGIALVAVHTGQHYEANMSEAFFAVPGPEIHLEAGSSSQGMMATAQRPETEWSDTLPSGWNVQCPDLEGLTERAVRTPEGPRGEPYGDGRAAQAGVRTLRGWRG